MKKRVYNSAEAHSDLYHTKQYIQKELCNAQAATKYIKDMKREIATLPDFPFKFSQTGISYRNKMIYKKAYGNHLIFYIVDVDNVVYVLRVLNDRMNWRSCLENVSLYHIRK